MPVGRYAQNAISDWIVEREKLVTNDDALFVNLKGNRISTRSVQERIKNIAKALALSRAKSPTNPASTSILSAKGSKILPSFVI